MHSTKKKSPRTIRMNMRKIALGFILAITVFSFQQGVEAIDGIIPAPEEEGELTCGAAYMSAQKEVEGKTVIDRAELKKLLTGEKTVPGAKAPSLGTKIKGGCVQLSDVPFIVIHLINICTKLAGTIAVIFLLYAGFQMIVSGVTDDREKAKNTIKYAITGLIVSFLAWVIVNLVQVQLTS